MDTNQVTITFSVSKDELNYLIAAIKAKSGSAEDNYRRCVLSRQNDTEYALHNKAVMDMGNLLISRLKG